VTDGASCAGRVPEPTPTLRAVSVLRLFHVRVLPELRSDFERAFAAVSVDHVRGHPGLLSVAIGRPIRPDTGEYLMVSTWSSLSDVERFAGEDWSAAVIPSEMQRFVVDCRVQHYQVFRGT
jgi:heme-degrading monooxygenase HmoA